MIAASDLIVRRGQRVVLDSVDLSANQGMTVGIVGPNGAGKSTLLSALYRNVTVCSGRITVSDRDVSAMSRREIAREIAVVAQSPDQALPLTVRDTVALGRLPHRSLMGYGDTTDRGIVNDALARTDLTSLACRLVTQLSGGERQRVLIARAIAQQAGHLLLDEPTNHLDIGYQFALLDLVHTIDATTIIVLHDLNLAARYDIPVGNDGAFFVSTDWNKQGETSFVLYDSTEFRADGNFEGGLKLGYTGGYGAWEVAAFARNITNEKNVKGVIENYMAAVYNEPRIVGVSVNVNWQ